MNFLKDMGSAPKDGTHIIIKGDCHDGDFISFTEAWWWKPKTIEQWENGARPHWEYLCKGGMFTVSNPVGWIPLPKER